MKAPEEVIRKLSVLSSVITYATDREGCQRLGVSRASFYRWERAADWSSLEALIKSLENKPPIHKKHAQRIPEELEASIRRMRLDEGLGSKRIADRIQQSGHRINRSTIQRVIRDVVAEQNAIQQEPCVADPQDGQTPAFDERAPLLTEESLGNALEGLITHAPMRLLALLGRHLKSQKAYIRELESILRAATRRSRQTG